MRFSGMSPSTKTSKKFRHRRNPDWILKCRSLFPAVWTCQSTKSYSTSFSTTMYFKSCATTSIPYKCLKSLWRRSISRYISISSSNSGSKRTGKCSISTCCHSESDAIWRSSAWTRDRDSCQLSSRDVQARQQREYRRSALRAAQWWGWRVPNGTRNGICRESNFQYIMYHHSDFVEYILLANHCVLYCKCYAYSILHSIFFLSHIIIVYIPFGQRRGISIADELPIIYVIDLVITMLLAILFRDISETSMAPQ